jgi:CheY-like chemotaxis protein
VDGDPVRLAQVFANLLNNAAKYTDGGGTIEFSGRREGAEAVVRVRDNGIGIPAQLLPHIFEMFTQGTTAGRAQAGLGIGLTLVRTLVEMHGGSVEAASAGAGAGSEFVVRLPLVLQDRDRLAPAQEPNPMLQGACRILVADDNRDAANSLASLLELIGAEVQVVYDGHAALDALETFPANVAILDIGMPGLDGYEVARRIREHPRFRDLTLVALTGWGQAEDRLRTRRSGFDFHLVKPADLQDLHRILQSQCD